MTVKSIAVATLVAGTLDIVSAAALAMMRDGSVAAMLRGIAAGPFGRWATDHAGAGAAAGVAVHYCLMAIMVIVFAWAARRTPALLEHPLRAGAVYGLLVYAVMYWIVIPLRWPEAPRDTSPAGLAIPMSIHIVLVGIPIALLLSRGARRRDARFVSAAHERISTG